MEIVFLDTNSVNIRDNENLDKINLLFDNKKIDIWVSDAIFADICDSLFSSIDDLPEKNKIPAKKRLEKSKKYSKAVGELVLDSPTLGLLDENILGLLPKEEEIKMLLFPLSSHFSDMKKNEYLDVRHLATAFNNNCNYFITEDNHFLNKKKEIKKLLNINVIKPDEYLFIK